MGQSGNSGSDGLLYIENAFYQALIELLALKAS